LDTPEKVAETPAQKLSEIIGTDAVIRGEITSYERIYAGLYSQVSVGAEIQMLDGKSGKELWWARDTSHRHGGGIPTTPVDLIVTALFTSVNMRDIELIRSSDDLFRDMITTIPQPTLAQILQPPDITSNRVIPVNPGPTAIQGVLTGKITWFAGASPYVIEGEVVVDHKATLIIEPGSVVRSQGGGITVLGKLMARGSRQSKITFEPAEPDQEWKGIVFSGTSDEESSIEFSKITGAAVGISCLSSSPLIENNDLSNNQVGLRISESFSNPKIRVNLISGNTLSCVEISSGAAPLLEGNEIRGNQEDGVVSNEANPTIHQNQILNNGEAGLRFISSSALLSQNNIHGNAKYDVYNSLRNDIPLEANENWWGTTEVLKLINRIHGRVDYQRVLDAPYPQGKPMELPILKSPLGGLVGKDSFLTLIHSPYILEENVVVDEGATLFIEAGVTLKFNSGTSLIVKDGAIDARGTSDQLITFTSNSSSPSPGSFQVAARLEQHSQVASSFRYCVIEFARTGLEIRYGAPDIRHCLITQNEHVGIKVTNSGAPSIAFNTFAHNAGAGAIVVLGSARPKIYRNNFEENPFAIQSQSPIYLDARENWWGENPPPESLFVGFINLEPWLDRPEPQAFIDKNP
jgi:parallel beta-helix repeat protein